MRAQVLERGGDTLLFGVRARAQRGIVPEEIAERRNQLTSADAGRPGAVAVSPDAVGESPDAPHAEAGLLDDELRPPADRGGARRGRISVEPQAATPGELWYYGAALRCNG